MAPILSGTVASANESARLKVCLQAHRLQPGAEADRENRIERSRDMLTRVLHMRTTVAFLGSGCSTPLGYPGWSAMARELIEETLRQSGKESPLRQRLEGFLVQLQLAVESHDSEDLKFMLATCQRALPEGNTVYQEYFYRHFNPRNRLKDSPNPYRSLLELPISRFITTNYDCEIERALYEAKDVSFPEVGFGSMGRPEDLERRPLSFTQRPEYRDQLALFSLARAEQAYNMVFHCHGRFDDPDSIIATESDYQRWYLTDHDGGSFRRTIEILFGSNPTLFIGYSVRDDDLLRHLRVLSALDPGRKHSRPIFALIPEKAEGAEWNRHEHLYDRYGVNVIPFTAPLGLEASEWGHILCGELDRLRQELQSRRLLWLEKPCFRTIKMPSKPPTPYRHSGLEPELEEAAGIPETIGPEIGAERVSKKLNELKERIVSGFRIIAFIGPGGTGKSWHASKLMKEVEQEFRKGGKGRFDGFFFWSSYYSDDALSGLDRLLKYLGEGDTTLPRLERLENHLKSSPAPKRYLIVFDGFERLLRQIGRLDEGEVYSQAVEAFIRIFADRHCRSTLVLTSRLWPKVLEGLAQVERVPLERMKTNDLHGYPPFDSNSLSPDKISALCALLDGHAYALALAAHMLRTDIENLELSIESLLHALARTPPDRRVSRVIQEVVENLNHRCGGIALGFLQRLAVFMSPVTYQACKICFESAQAQLSVQSKGILRQVELGELLDLLVGSRIVFKIGPSVRQEDLSYTVHPTVRSFVFERLHGVEQDTVPSFTLSGLTSGTAAVYPGGRESVNILRDLYERLITASDQTLSSGRKAEALGYCRALFSAVRSRMEANTAPRWCSYDEYLRFGLQLADLVKRLSPKRWTYRERHEIANVEDDNAPLYADELAWLYNDIGLTLCSEGQMSDCYAIWEQGYEINRLIEGSSQMPRYTLQSQLHLAHTFLELGRLRIADQFLDETEKTNSLLNSKDYEGRILGYRAILSHLHGNFEESSRFYESSFGLLQGTRNSRAQSFFMSHHVGLEIRQGHFEGALRMAKTSRALAETEHYPDLVAYARLALGKVLRHLKRFSEATAELYASLEVARAIGIGRLEAEVLAELSKLALGLGDVEIATQRAMDSLQVANALELGLRQVSALTALGPAIAAAGQRALGVAYLKHASNFATQQEYWLRKQEADECLRRLGEPPPLCR
jgi:hypothetical protein